MFRDAAKRFAAERAPVAQLRKLRDDADAVGFSREVWKEMAEMGWAGVLVPEEHGGVGFGFVGAGLIAEEIGRNLSATPLLSTAVLAVTALLRGGSAAQKEALLPAIAGGEYASWRWRRTSAVAPRAAQHRHSRDRRHRQVQAQRSQSFTCSTATSPIG